VGYLESMDNISYGAVLLIYLFVIFAMLSESWGSQATHIEVKKKYIDRRYDMFVLSRPQDLEIGFF
jgi:hypothetical protein